MTIPGGVTPAPADAVELGSWLRSERERRGLTLQQAAEELHLAPMMIAAIEQDRYAALGPPVYARGYLRKYALLLGLDPTAVLERYQSLHGTPAQSAPVPVNVVSAPPLRERRSPKWPQWVAVIAVIAAGAWWVFDRYVAPQPVFAPPRSVRANEANAVADQNVERSAALNDSVTPAVQPPAAQSAAQPSADQGAAATAEQPVPAAPPASPQSSTAPAAAVSATGELQLRLEFSQPSWAEVYDANGRKLMFDLGAPERARTMSGAAPLRVTLGLADAVSAEVNGRAIVVPRRAGRDAAKFVIEADGSVRLDAAAPRGG